QRADVIHDLITPFREQDGLERIYMPDWRQRLSKWPKAEDILPYVFYRRYAEVDGETAPSDLTVSDLEVVEKPPFKSRIYSPDFPTGDDQFVLYADDLEQQDETQGAEDDDERANTRRTQAANKPVFVIDENGEYASYDLRLDRSEHHAIFAFDYSMAWTSPGYCPMKIYFRRKGDPVLRSTRAMRMPSVMLSAPDSQETPDEYDIVVRRGACDRQSQEYLFGIVSWRPETAPAETNMAFAPSEGRRILASFDRSGDRLENFFNCKVAPFGDEAKCEESIKVRNLTVKNAKTD
ncbi:MAG: hypothetical protein ACX939_10240, partial [Hyphococcus sp.]